MYYFSNELSEIFHWEIPIIDAGFCSPLGDKDKYFKNIFISERYNLAILNERENGIWIEKTDTDEEDVGNRIYEERDGYVVITEDKMHIVGIFNLDKYHYLHPHIIPTNYRPDEVVGVRYVEKWQATHVSMHHSGPDSLYAMCFADGFVDLKNQYGHESIRCN